MGAHVPAQQGAPAHRPGVRGRDPLQFRGGLACVVLPQPSAAHAVGGDSAAAADACRAGGTVGHCRHRARHGLERAVDGPQPAAVPCLSRSGGPGLCGLVQGTL